MQVMHDVMKRYHRDLVDAEVRVDLLLAFSLDGSPAIVVQGHAAAAACRILTVGDRAKGNGDAEIRIDGDECETWTETQLVALLDHELTHIELMYGKRGLKRDSLGRPKAKIRVHDRQIGWFDDVAERHRMNAWECLQMRQMLTDEEFCRLYLPELDQTQRSILLGAFGR